MSEKDDALELIAELKKGHYKATCNSCDETFDLAKAGLFYSDELTPEAKEIMNTRLEEAKTRILELKANAARKMVRVEAAAKSVNIGFAVERIAPVLNGFEFDRNDCRSLFDPIDYVIFDGLSKSKRIERIIFSEIKSGKARLNDSQQQIKLAVEAKRVGFYRYGRAVQL